MRLGSDVYINDGLCVYLMILIYVGWFFSM